MKDIKDSGNVDIQAIAVVCDILDFIERSPARVSAAQIGRELNMTAPRVGRYLSSMQSLGLVDTLPGERGYSLGWKLIRLGQSAIDKNQLTEVAFAEAERLRNDINKNVYVTSTYDYGGAVIIFLRAFNPVALHLPLGMYFEGHSSASGRVIMAFSPESVQEEFLNRALNFEGFPDPILDKEALKQRYDLIRQRMYDVAGRSKRKLEERKQHISGVAAPIFGQKNKIVGTIGIISGMAEPEQMQEESLVTELCNTAARISRYLGGSLWESRMSVKPFCNT